MGNSVAIDKEVGKGFLLETSVCHSLWTIDGCLKRKGARVNKAQRPKEKYYRTIQLKLRGVMQKQEIFRCT